VAEEEQICPFVSNQSFEMCCVISSTCCFIDQQKYILIGKEAKSARWWNAGARQG